jgi:exopolyphosphatase / guanosine-5'-triphosphate,3'-diphosphate pyrophosphatase
MPERQLYAAIDLGSNSFHMVVARSEHGELRIIDRIKDMVRLAGGLDEHGRLDTDTREQALASLARFGQRIRAIPDHQIRAVGTQTFRRLKNPAAFLVVAETALGCPIDIISGLEEARLVYTGVNQATPPSGGHRLVIDIGGGSTEIVLGESHEPIEAESLAFGCVGVSRRAFPDGRISRDRWRSASRQILGELQRCSGGFRELGWQQAVGTSGTIRAVSDMLIAANPGSTINVTPARLDQLKQAILEAGHSDRIALEGLSERRKPVIAGGIVVLEAVMSALHIEELTVSPFALREGVLYDLMGRLTQRDPREQTVTAMASRYQVDQAQADRIDDWTATAFQQVSDDWQLRPVHADLLRWISRLHEIGLSLTHDDHHRHTAYMLEHADMAGFSRQEQQFMATICRLQQRRIEADCLQELPTRLQTPARRLLALLRLATALYRARSDASAADFALRASGQDLCLELPAGWLANNPLTRQDLQFEQRQLARIDIRLELADLHPGLTAS